MTWAAEERLLKTLRGETTVQDLERRPRQDRASLHQILTAQEIWLSRWEGRHGLEGTAAHSHTQSETLPREARAVPLANIHGRCTASVSCTAHMWAGGWGWHERGWGLVLAAYLFQGTGARRGKYSGYHTISLEKCFGDSPPPQDPISFAFTFTVLYPLFT